MKRVTFLEEDLKVIFGSYMEPAGFMGEGQEIVGFEFRTRTLKKDGSYKDVAPPGDSETVELRKVIVVLR